MFPANRQADRERTISKRPPNALGRLLNSVVFWGLLIVVPIAVVPYGTVDAWWEAVFECLVFSLAALWVLEALFNRNWQIRGLPIILPAMLITIYAFLQVVAWPPSWLVKSTSQHMLTIDHYQTYLTARKILALTLFMVVLLGHTSTLKRLRWTVRIVVGVGLASALFGILRQFLQPADATGGFVLPFLFYGAGYAQFISPNPFAYLMEITLGLLAGLVLGGGVRKNRALIYLAIMVVVWTALVLSNSRGGLVGLACEAVFVLFIALNWYSERITLRGRPPNRWVTFMRRSNLLRVIVIVSVIGILAGGVVWMGGDQLVNKIADRSPATAGGWKDGGTRQEIWRASWKLFKDRPWTGTGFGAYFLGITHFETSSGRTRLEQAHNDYLDLAASGGVIALALAAWFVAMIIWTARRRLRASDSYRRAAALGAATAALGLSIHSVVDFGLQLTGVAVVFIAVIVILVADVMPETSNPALSISAHVRRELPRPTDMYRS